MPDLLTDLAPPTLTSSSLTPSDLLSLNAAELDISALSSLASLSDLEAISTCAQLLLTKEIDDAILLKGIIDIGLDKARVNGLADGIRDEVKLENQDGGLMREYAVLLEMRRRLETYALVWPDSTSTSQLDIVREVRPEPSGNGKEAQASAGKSEDEGMELDDPWGETDQEDQPGPFTAAEGSNGGHPPTQLEDPWDQPEASTSAPTSPASPARSLKHASADIPTSPPISLASFLTRPVTLSCFELATHATLSPLRKICQRHISEVHPYRFSFVEAIPGCIPPSELEAESLLPASDDRWVFNRTTTSSEDQLGKRLFTLLPSSMTVVPTHIPSEHDSPDLTAWYTSHILSLDSLGLLDLQLAWVQHGASLGVSSLDEVVEDLSLLSRLAYDANLTPVQQAQWTLSAWRQASEANIISAYLSNSTPRSVVGDIKRLVMPYLYVLESRTERAGQADPNLIENNLYDAILSLPLQLALSIFESSKATLAPPERLIKNDMDVARLALAILYGSEEREAHIWGTMSSIFECLPVWELSGTDSLSDSELTSTTLDSIATFIRPTTASAPAPKAKDLFLFFHPLPFASLSRALDILDVHLESGEILARWKTPVQLRYLLQSSRDESDQRELAEKLLRRQIGRGLNDDAWRRLWDDMNRLAGGDDSLLRGALGMLGQEERARIYLGGVLASGNFDAARSAIRRLKPENELDDEVVERVVLTTSKEFYLGAESGNVHTGEMKLAYDCLSVAPPTSQITSEKKYIEATSRLSSFSSLHLTPVEIRQTPPLTLISRVLTTSMENYKHPEMLLELADKLGATDHSQKGLVWGMIGLAALSQNDWAAAKESVEGMMRLVKEGDKRNKKHKHGAQSSASISSVNSVGSSTIIGQGGPSKASTSSSSGGGGGGTGPDELAEKTWRLAHSLASQTSYDDTTSKLSLLGRALDLCPASSIPDILATYRLVEAERRRHEGGNAKSSRRAKRKPSGLGLGLGLGSEATQGAGDKGEEEEERVLGSRTAARAAKMALDLGERFHLRELASASRGIASPRLGGASTPTPIPTYSSSLSKEKEKEMPSPHLPATDTSATAPGSAAHSSVSMSVGDRGRSIYAAGADLARTISNSSRASHASHASHRSQSQSGTRAAGAGELFDGLNVNVQGAADEAERVRAQARRALVRGVGWLLGAEEGEIS